MQEQEQEEDQTKGTAHINNQVEQEENIKRTSRGTGRGTARKFGTGTGQGTRNLELETGHYELGQQQEMLEQEQDKEQGTWNSKQDTMN